VAKEPQLPQQIKDLVVACAKTFGNLPSNPNGLSIESYGHVDRACGGSVGKLEITQIRVELDPPAPAAAEPAPAASAPAAPPAAEPAPAS
jgi:hypothetical protein